MLGCYCLCRAIKKDHVRMLQVFTCQKGEPGSEQLGVADLNL